jgi:mannose-6-phosphate isomerase-like protein (cupin superfamily)
MMFNLLTRRASALLLLAAFSADAEDAPAPSSENLKYVNYYDLSWTEDPGIPLSSVARWKTLLGTGGIFGEGLPDEDMYIRQGEMGPGALYPKHRHAAPEFWYFISGRAQWTVDGETFDVEPGSTIYLKPGSSRSLRITSKEKAEIVRGNWGVNCDNESMMNAPRPGALDSDTVQGTYVYAGDYSYATYPQADRARLPIWDHGNARRPVEGSNSVLAPPLSASSTVHLKHVNFYDVRYAPDPTGVRRWKTLVGSGSWGDGLPDEQIQWGLGELGSGGIYDHHHHAWPEFYHVVSGQARIEVDGDEFVAGPGSMVYHNPWAMHRSEIVSKSKTVVMWANWVTGCDREVLQEPYEVLEPIPVQPLTAILVQ